jgi:hypothetical protein
VMHSAQCTVDMRMHGGGWLSIFDQTGSSGKLWSWYSDMFLAVHSNQSYASLS